MLMRCLAIGMALCFPVTSCKRAPKETAPSAPVISAAPNPVPDGSGPGQTTISWDTGDGSMGEVYVSVGGRDEKLFGGKSAKQALEAAWIQSGDVCDFRLYKGTDHTELLASVTVTRPKIDGTLNRTGQPLIIATPNPVPPGKGPGKTTVFWDTGDGSVGEVYVSVNGAEEKLFGKLASTSLPAPWIPAGSKCEFRLYRQGDRTTPISSVLVTRGKE